jgi:hypothetical protein
MKYLLISLAVLIGLIIWLLLRRAKPTKYRIALSDVDVRKFLRVLLYRGYNGGFLIIEAREGEPFIQFSKYIANDRVGIQFDFPQAPWSKDYFDPLKQALDRRFSKYKVSDVPGSDLSNPVTKFLEIDLGQDLEAAAELARLSLVDVFKVDPNENLTIYFDGVSPKDQKIGF